MKKHNITMMALAVIFSLAFAAKPAYAAEALPQDTFLSGEAEEKNGIVTVTFDDPVTADKDAIFLERSKLETNNQEFWQRFGKVSTIAEETGDEYKAKYFVLTVARTEEEAKERAKAVDAKADDIAKNAASFKSRKAKVLSVTAQLCDLAQYKKGPRPWGELSDETSPYGVLVNGEGNCKGYSEAFYLCMEKLGIPCEFVLSENGNHMWVMVQGENGTWYHVDATICDSRGFDGNFWEEGEVFLEQGGNHAFK